MGSLDAGMGRVKQSGDGQALLSLVIALVGQKQLCHSADSFGLVSQDVVHSVSVPSYDAGSWMMLSRSNAIWSSGSGDRP
jgi:hypothetical protein